MITKAIVEQVLSPYQVKLRIPLFNKADSTTLATDTSDLTVATICSIPNCYINFQVGDVVFVGFEDNTYYKAVILGHLSRKAMSDTYSDVVFRTLDVKGEAKLSSQTSIGDVSPHNIRCLERVKYNLQDQIDEINLKLSSLLSNSEGGVDS